MSNGLPHAENAFIDLAKLRDYCLNPDHPEGRHKARVFASALGIGRADAEWLQSAIRTGILGAPLAASENSTYGIRYAVDIPLQRGELGAIVRTGWIVRSGEEIPRLTTCYVL